MSHRILTVFMNARRILMACVFLWATITPLPAQSAETARILYTADTHGYLHPCASCGDTSQGGLARRAALLHTLAAGQKRPLIIAGPNEFADDSRRSGSTPEDAKARALHAAFSRMPYSGVYLTPPMAEAFDKLGLQPLPHGILVSDKPVTEYYRAGNLAVACVFFPPGPPGDGQPNREQLDAVMLAGMEAARTASLVIGISPWGMHPENNLMGSPAFEPFHIILGGGEGIAVPGQGMSVQGRPGPLWARADRRGKALNVLDIYMVPEKGAAWLDGIHFSSRLVFLEKNLPEDGEVLKIISAVPD